jgi:hypothetical protein
MSPSSPEETSAMEVLILINLHARRMCGIDDNRNGVLEIGSRDEDNVKTATDNDASAAARAEEPLAALASPPLKSSTSLRFCFVLLRRDSLAATAV